MRRFAIFATVLLLLVVVGSQPRAVGSQRHSFCACMASRAALIMKSIGGTAPTTTAQAHSQAHGADAATSAE